LSSAHQWSEVSRCFGFKLYGSVLGIITARLVGIEDPIEDVDHAVPVEEVWE
jgi:hypothetical protein